MVAEVLRWLWSALLFFPRKLAAFWSTPKPRPIRYIKVEDFPATLESAKVYLAGEGTNLWGAAMICPCGCGEVIELNLLNQVRPCWSAEEHPDGTVSLAPSVWRQKGCKSHFFLRRGEVEWC
ncbi:DUF6527 family protein [Paraburkholderia aspalathi]|uniref:DUF6527 family protein n=1 Tax=Paraburkholderia aspalathi TaxID=1324617 RepID=UPI003CC246DE